MRQAYSHSASLLRQHRQPDLGALVSKKLVDGVIGPNAMAKLSESMRANRAPSVEALVSKKLVDGVIGPNAMAKLSESMRANRAPSVEALVSKKLVDGVIGPNAMAKLSESMRASQTRRPYGLATGSPLADALGLRISPTVFEAAAGVARDFVIAEPGMLADELGIPQAVDGTGFVWPCPSLDDLKTLQHVFWLSMIVAFSITLTVTGRIPDPVAVAWGGAAERSLALAIWLLERRQGK